MNECAPVDWNASLTTGVAALDRQHRILVNALNELAASISDGSNFRRVDQVTRDLLAYAIFHFETEEELMKRCGYDKAYPDDARIHVLQHREFSERVVSVRTETGQNMRNALAALHHYLMDWLTKHIATFDQRLAGFIRASPVSLDSQRGIEPQIAPKGR